MSASRPAPTSRRRPRPTSLVLLLLTVALTGLVGAHALGDQQPDAAPAVVPVEAPTGSRHEGAPDAPAQVPSDRQDRLGVADGEVPDGVTVFDDTYPAVADLDPDLLAALREAAADAREDGVELQVSSGWRSRAYQEQLLAEAVEQYGSEEEAARWVATADTSLHVSGDAVDLGGSEATRWLSAHGAGYGLCQVYVNEPWHYELRPDAADHGCPALYADPTQDPRMQR